ncbi:arsenate reductase and protein tyrosine phosphatase [Citrifermentans bemidjiense Bem]|uniref:Arsenate reductase and protein tyrosine phosphatase n=1 Tax=Citrifermentans bemidjiense (strain ATCC BAA-1014 / DSM 16622 / JCM 12645 / Bem) TaxID=404380 RepID=B5EF51_CITBB|nr:arsenate reductase ArsC [Citrifermentans bemidjiense]ACH39360.1 arsenate reductase and protein tyrosine phosphatase [Citrifermentans bemidjiense Bem]
MQQKVRVLFVCIHNSARSQMGEAFLKQAGGERFEVRSAGIESGRLNPLVVQAMKEVDIDISGNKTKQVSDFIDSGELFDYVITVCDETSAERCPLFPGQALRLHWGFPDPSVLQGTDEEKLSAIRSIRDAIKEKVKTWSVTV